MKAAEMLKLARKEGEKREKKCKEREKKGNK